MAKARIPSCLLRFMVRLQADRIPVCVKTQQNKDVTAFLADE